LRTFGGRVFGSGPTASACAQNKFLQYAVFKSLGVTTPQSWSRDLPNLGSHPANGYFVKPCNLGNSIGIFDDAHGCGWSKALDIATRIEDVYGVKAIIQEYITGLYCRASFIGCRGNRPTLDDIGVHALILPDEGSRPTFTTFSDYYASYLKDNNSYNARVYSIPIDMCLKWQMLSAEEDRQLRMCLKAIIGALDLSGIFTIDIIVRSGTPYFLEVNTNPFLRNAALRSYAMESFGVNAEQAYYRAIKNAGCEC
jgi:D-alanine-D-alanine ligase-like ATP-grasp enzyme